MCLNIIKQGKQMTAEIDKIDRYWLSNYGMIKLAKEHYNNPEAKVYEWVKYDDIKNHILDTRKKENK